MRHHAHTKEYQREKLNHLNQLELSNDDVISRAELGWNCRPISARGIFFIVNSILVMRGSAELKSKICYAIATDISTKCCNNIFPNSSQYRTEVSQYKRNLNLAMHQATYSSHIQNLFMN